MLMMEDKKKSIAAILGPVAKEEKEGAGDGALSMIAEDLIYCITNHDVKGVEDCLRAAFAALEAEPHEEGPHI